VADKLGAPIVKAQLGEGCVPDDSPFTTGPIGLVGSRPSEEALAGCDALLIVGSAMPYIEYYPQPGQAVCAQIDDKPERIGLRYPADIGLCGDARATLAELAPLLARPALPGAGAAGMRAWRELMEERGTSTDLPMHPQVPAWALNDALAADAIVCGDSGTVTTWAARQVRTQRGQLFSFSGTNCSMAAGLPYAIGAQAALGLIKWEQMVFLGNPEYGVNMAPFDFVKFAQACGARGVRIEDPQRCGQQLSEALSWDGPAIIECVTDEHEPPYPAKIKKEQVKSWRQRCAKARPTASGSPCRWSGTCSTSPRSRPAPRTPCRGR
jgi:pyruvate dehydrogenase (quinone)